LAAAAHPTIAQLSGSSFMTKNATVVFIGWGAINAHVGALLAQRKTAIDIVGIATIDTAEARASVPQGVRFLRSPDELAALRPDIVVEAAGRAAIDMWAEAALKAAPAMIIASTSAFCDDGLLPRLAVVAETHGSRILIPSGAIGGVDALASAAVLGLDEVTHQIVKPPVAWKGTPAEKLLDLSALSERTIFFSGTAREAAGQYPQNANATVVTSLAGIGLDKTRVELVADPAFRSNGHRIVARGAFGRMDITLENNPLPTNPKSSELTALSLVRLIEHQVNVVII
jgi:aspartate dehydrogenase